ncbi:hypothetical protein BDQ12DRAFT_747890 [Crucibulum laeve]|uniref:Uncharacterized protein n=1 Tax=Crucibulum laeve TaxID=68775 RepID=A0A5C3M0M7_9AGAR|nr:hypothetical protein BDQ12DRAFT_747890 [Crucibulum laeve]
MDTQKSWIVRTNMTVEFGEILLTYAVYSLSGAMLAFQELVLVSSFLENRKHINKVALDSRIRGMVHGDVMIFEENTLIRQADNRQVPQITDLVRSRLLHRCHVPKLLSSENTKTKLPKKQPDIYTLDVVTLEIRQGKRHFLKRLILEPPSAYALGCYRSEDYRNVFLTGRNFLVIVLSKILRHKTSRKVNHCRRPQAIRRIITRELAIPVDTGSKK